MAASVRVLYPVARWTMPIYDVFMMDGGFNKITQAIFEAARMTSWSEDISGLGLGPNREVNHADSDSLEPTDTNCLVYLDWLGSSKSRQPESLHITRGIVSDENNGPRARLLTFAALEWIRLRRTRWMFPSIACVDSKCWSESWNEPDAG